MKKDTISNKCIKNSRGEIAKDRGNNKSTIRSDFIVVPTPKMTAITELLLKIDL
jgi:hypothetical protein